MATSGEHMLYTTVVVKPKQRGHSNVNCGLQHLFQEGEWSNYYVNSSRKNETLKASELVTCTCTCNCDNTTNWVACTFWGWSHSQYTCHRQQYCDHIYLQALPLALCNEEQIFKINNNKTIASINELRSIVPFSGITFYTIRNNFGAFF